MKSVRTYFLFLLLLPLFLSPLVVGGQDTLQYDNFSYESLKDGFHISKGDHHMICFYTKGGKPNA